MRQNVIIALLAVCATLMGVHVLLNRGGDRLPFAFGQNVGNLPAGKSGDFIIATGVNQSGNESVLWVFEVGTRKLAAYTVRNRGIEYKGVRDIQYDLKPVELIPRRALTPGQVEEAYRKSKGTKK